MHLEQKDIPIPMAKRQKATSSGSGAASSGIHDLNFSQCDEGALQWSSRGTPRDPALGFRRKEGEGRERKHSSKPNSATKQSAPQLLPALGRGRARPLRVSSGEEGSMAAKPRGSQETETPADLASLPTLATSSPEDRPRSGGAY